MIEAPKGTDLWTAPLSTTSIVVITTNGDVRKDGRAVMGRGCAAEAAGMKTADGLRLDRILGRLLQSGGNHVYDLGWYASENESIYRVVSFPVKHHWYNDAKLGLIERSTLELVELVDRNSWHRIRLPRPGCGNGRLRWADVKPVLEPLLDDRFVVVHK